MILADLLTSHWQRSATSSAAILAIWSYVLLGNQQAALADSPSKTAAPKNIKRPTARIGVSAVVLPRCIVRVTNTQTQASSQPVEILCTKNTDYQLAVQRPGQEAVSIRAHPSSQPSSRQAGRQSIQKTHYQLPQASSSENRQTQASGEITILALDF